MTHQPNEGRSRTLVVDDHVISGRHVKAALERSPGKVRTARTASKAVDLALTWHPHLICMDIHLPDQNGLDAIRQIRKNWPADHPVPRIIIMTGDGSAPDPAALAELRVERLLVKPVSGNQLRRLVSPHLGNEMHEPFPGAAQVEMESLFKTELRQRIPELDRHMEQLERAEMAGILHQLIASAAMCGKFLLESNLRALNNLCRNGDSAEKMAACYHQLLESTDDFLSSG